MAIASSPCLRARFERDHGESPVAGDDAVFHPVPFTFDHAALGGRDEREQLLDLGTRARLRPESVRSPGSCSIPRASTDGTQSAALRSPPYRKSAPRRARRCSRRTPALPADCWSANNGITSCLITLYGPTNACSPDAAKLMHAAERADVGPVPNGHVSGERRRCCRECTLLPIWQSCATCV